MEMNLQRAREPVANRDRRRLLIQRRLLPWAAIAVVAAIHLTVAIRNVGAGVHRVVPLYGQAGAELADWLVIVLRLFVKPQVSTATGQIFALWALVLLVLSIFTALMEGDSLPEGVKVFFGYTLATLFVLAVVVPVSWILLGTWGPAATEFAPILVLTGVAALLMPDLGRGAD